MNKITKKLDDKEVSIELTDVEVIRAKKAMDKNSLKEIFILKSEKGAMQLFTNAKNATNALHRHNFDYLFTVSKTDLNKIQIKNENALTDKLFGKN